MVCLTVKVPSAFRLASTTNVAAVPSACAVVASGPANKPRVRKKKARMAPRRWLFLAWIASTTDSLPLVIGLLCSGIEKSEALFDNDRPPALGESGPVDRSTRLGFRCDLAALAGTATRPTAPAYRAPGPGVMTQPQWGRAAPTAVGAAGSAAVGAAGPARVRRIPRRGQSVRPGPGDLFAGAQLRAWSRCPVRSRARPPPAQPAAGVAARLDRGRDRGHGRARGHRVWSPSRPGWRTRTTTIRSRRPTPIRRRS